MKRDCTICVAKTKALISFAITAELICAFIFCPSILLFFSCSGIIEMKCASNIYLYLFLVSLTTLRSTGVPDEKMLALNRMKIHS